MFIQYSMAACSHGHTVFVLNLLSEEAWCDYGSLAREKRGIDSRSGVDVGADSSK